MKHSKALTESIESAQLLASHFETDYLESWQLLIAMANNPYSVAGSVLNDYPLEIDDFEKAAFHITGKVYQQEGDFTIWPFSYRMKVLFLTAEQIAGAVHANNLGTEHILLAMLFDRGSLAARILEFIGFSYEDKEGGLRMTKQGYFWHKIGSKICPEQEREV